MSNVWHYCGSYAKHVKPDAAITTIANQRNAPWHRVTAAGF